MPGFEGTLLCFSFNVFENHKANTNERQTHHTTKPRRGNGPMKLNPSHFFEFCWFLQRLRICRFTVGAWWKWMTMAEWSLSYMPANQNLIFRKPQSLFETLAWSIRRGRKTTVLICLGGAYYCSAMKDHKHTEAHSNAIMMNNAYAARC